MWRSKPEVFNRNKRGRESSLKNQGRHHEIEGATVWIINVAQKPMF
jgi:hypothetical protein